ncbi:SCO3374 family protein [Streptomyces sp. NPDC028635]|uniref:SCO3374 family protein n=1 Tax=Streptomyces sp. NPDC028635 TaxID=3154800 RepID=UPI00340A01BF
MAGAVPPWPTVPFPRRSPERADPLRHWYENELGWPVVPGEPVRLSVGPRFDVLDVPAEAGRAALRHLAPTSPVALHGDRMRLLLAPGSAEELPGLLEWLEWGPLAASLDLRALGPGSTLEAPAPVPFPGEPPGASCVSAPAWSAEGAGQWTAGVPGGPAAAGIKGPQRLEGPTASRAGARAGAGPEEAAVTGPPTGPRGVGTRAAGTGAVGAWAARIGRSAASQGAAVWLRPPVPGSEAESSLPTMSALGGRAGTPDLVRVVDTVATRCHRIRLRRACAQPLAFS